MRTPGGIDNPDNCRFCNPKGEVLQQKSCSTIWIDHGPPKRLYWAPVRHGRRLPTPTRLHATQHLYALITTKYPEFDPGTIEVKVSTNGHIYVTARASHA